MKIRILFSFFQGQSDFAVIHRLSLFYFATMVVLGAQINAFCFGNNPSFVEGLGAYISQMHEQHGVGSEKMEFNDEDSQLQG